MNEPARDRGAALFAAAVVVHMALVVWLGNAWPGGLRSDENVYLELASNLWFDGTYGTKVSVTYPPLYPMFVAPTFALASNALRFAVLHGVQALLMGLASLALLPALTQALGRRRAWGALALLQLLAGSTHYLRTAQTEGLFIPLVVLATGLAFTAWQRGRVRDWLWLGLVCGLALSTRRMGVVLFIAVGLGVAWDVVDGLVAWARGRWGASPSSPSPSPSPSSSPSSSPSPSPSPSSSSSPSSSPRSFLAALPWRAVLGLVLGGLLGHLPELGAGLIAGDAMDPYTGDAARRHLDAASDAFNSPANLQLAVELVARHAAYVTASTFGAPIVVVILLLIGRDAPRSVLRGCTFALLVSLGLQALTVLHMLRFRYRRPDAEGWDLYARYVDPAELPLIVAALVAAVWLLRPGGPLTSAARRLVVGLPWVVLMGIFAVIAGAFSRPRGGRWPKAVRLEMLGFPPQATPWVFLGFVLVVLLGWLVWWTWGRADRVAGLGSLALAVAVSWCIGAHLVVAKLTVEPVDPRPPILQVEALEADPRAPLAVVVYEPGPFGRDYYAPAFRSDHPVTWVKPGRAATRWLRANPSGFLLVRVADLGGKPGISAPRVARAGDWQAHRRALGAPPEQ